MSARKNYPIKINYRTAGMEALVLHSEGQLKKPRILKVQLKG